MMPGRTSLRDQITRAPIDRSTPLAISALRTPFPFPSP